MISLQEIFIALNKKHKYAAIKLFESFPLAIAGSEIDLFCQDANLILQTLIPSMNKYIDEGYEITVEEKDHYINIDMINNNNLELRWKLYRSLPKLKKISIRDSLFDVIVERAVICKINRSGNESVEVYVPEFFDDLLLKYIEYQEWYSMRGDKVKHAEYVQGLLTTEEIKKKFFDRVHYYTKFSGIEEEDTNISG
ncbi:MAG: hypothetical protein K0U41_02495 [Gammaproteobacteria bacterium]|nr:hypothetical protein [Gammaproteobacteria bacterium]